MRDDFQIPNFGEGPAAYEKGYLNRLVRNIEMTFRALKAKGAIHATTLEADSLLFPGGVPMTDYRTGTWTPSFAFGGDSTGMVYGAREGTYTKIGNVVVAGYRVALTAKGSGVGSATITGLPFSIPGSDGKYGGTFAGQYFGFTGLTGALMFPTFNGTNVTIGQSAATGIASVSDTNFTATTQVRAITIYQV